MATKVERQMAEQVLLGQIDRPAEQLLLAGLESLAGVRRALRPMVEELLTARDRVVRCQLKRGARFELCIGSLRTEIPERFKTQDPETGLTVVKERIRVQVDDRTIMRFINRAGTPQKVMVPSIAARVLAERCGGDPVLVDRACAAIERARKRYFDLAETATRWR